MLHGIVYFYWYTDSSFAEEHSEQEGHEEQGHEDEGHDDHGHEEGPTVFSNQAQEFGAIFDLAVSGNVNSSKVMVNYLAMDESIVGHEAFMDPVESESFNIGYYVSRNLPGDFDLDLGFRYDQINRKGSVTEEHHEEEGHDDHGDEDHDDQDDDEDDYMEED